MSSFPFGLVSFAGETRYALDDPFLDRYLVRRMPVRADMLTATMFDLKTFSTDVDRDAVRVTPADVFGFFAAQRGPTVLRLPTGRRRDRRHAVFRPVAPVSRVGRRRGRRGSGSC